MTQHTDLIERLHASSRWWFDRGVRNSVDADAIAALEAQAVEIERLRKDVERWRWATEQAEFFSMVVDGTGLHCAEVPEAESAVDAAIAMKGQP